MEAEREDRKEREALREEERKRLEAQRKKEQERLVSTLSFACGKINCKFMEITEKC